MASDMSGVFPSGGLIYPVLMVVGIGMGAAYWVRAAKTDSRLPMIYFTCLVGAFAGAKLAFLFAEGWLHFHDPNRWEIWLSGKSVMGALPGGWLGVEMAKKLTSFRESTGDRFAMLLPMPLILGRMGCLSAGCCKGVICSLGVWPSVPVEIAFQFVALLVLWLMRWKRWLTGQHFHFYLISYGLFRFGHEFLRATPKPLCGFSGYQFIALATVIAGAVAYRLRSNRTL